MAKFNIYSPGRVVLASACPKYNAAYGKPAYLEFNISSPTAINFTVGSYVDWRDGRRYKLYSVPEPKKQAGSGLAGDAFVYQNLQFHDQSKELENLIFTDLVLSSGSYFFSSRESTSTYEDLDGIMARIEACLDNQSNETWYVRKASGFDSDADLSAVASEPHEFSISGQSILEACNQVTEIFKGVGWIYDYARDGDIHYIYFGGPNVRTVSGTTTYGDGTTGTFLYGKGNGLVSIKKYITNKDKLCTRLYAYGSERNMPLRWYNNQSIYQAANVDIPNLMIPMSEWGITNFLPNAQLAFINNSGTEEALYGLIPRRVYFNNEENGDIYPSIKGVTIGDVQNAYDSRIYTDITYKYPSSTIYPDDTQRIDEIESATNPGDDGNLGDSTVHTVTKTKNTPQISFTEAMIESYTGNISQYITYFSTDALTTKGTFTLSVGQAQVAYLVVRAEDTDGNVYSTRDAFEAVAVFDLRVELRANGQTLGSIRGTKEYLGSTTVSGKTCFIYGVDINMFSTVVSDTECYTNDIEIYLAGGIRIGEYSWCALMTGTRITEQTAEGDGPMGLTLAYKLASIAKVTIKQIGFDLSDVTALNGQMGTLNLLNGMCGGRSFTITRCDYIAASDCYSLTILRVQDDSTGMLYPNATFTIDAGDQFVLTDIYMPDMYVAFGSQKLLAAAEEYYALNSTPKYLYTPEIDSSKIADGTFPLPHPGMYMALQDAQITGGSTEYVLIDSVTVAEGESNIPVVNITLRERLNVPSSS